VITRAPQPELPTPLTPHRATADDRAALERLWLMFRHEMSSHTRALPSPDGTYRSERLERALIDPAWGAWILTAGQHPIGLALARALDQPVHVLNSFFVVAPARRRGVGSSFASAVVDAHPGTWTVAFQDANTAAARFWPALAAGYDPAWRLEHRRVPDRPELPPDAWVTFRADPPRTR
jgi:predicted acetyltransferase